MPLDFPSSPAIGTVWTGSNGCNYVWDGAKWYLQAVAPLPGPYVPISGNTTVTGPLSYTATGTGTVARSLQSRWAERLSATDFGIICDGVTDQGAQLNAALASLAPGSTLYVPGSIYTTVTIMVPNGIRLEMPQNSTLRPATPPGNTLIVTKYAIVGTASLSPVVLSTGSENSMVNVGVTRNGTPAAHSVGLQVLGQDHVYSRVYSYNHARCIQCGLSQSASGLNYSITTRFDHCFTWNTTEDGVYLISAPETTFYDHRFGINGVTDPGGANSLVCLDGDSNNSTAAATNTVSFVRCQFNAGATVQQLYSVRILACNYGIFKFLGCYSGGSQNAFLYVDPASTRVLGVSITDCTISPLMSGETLISDTGSKLNDLKLIGNRFDPTGAGPNLLSLGGISAMLIGNTLGGGAAITLNAMTGGCCIGNTAGVLTVSGAFTGGAFVCANNTMTTFNLTATGTVSYSEPQGNYGAQLTLGKTGQAGRIDLKRGVDGALDAWVGYISAAGSNHIGMTNVSGTSNVILNATLADVFQVSGAEVGRFSVNGIGAAKVTAAAAAPGAGLATLAFIAGTTAGTGKLVAYCGTSTTPVTIVDNIGAGF